MTFRYAKRWHRLNHKEPDEMLNKQYQYKKMLS